MAWVKICPECEEKVYSADKRDWECPHCNRDLDYEELLTSEDLPLDDEN